MTAPVTEIDRRYGEPDAEPRSWEEASRLLAEAELGWLSTVRPDGRPHVTPLYYVWRGGALHVCSGTGERKTRNLARNPHVAFTTGVNKGVGGIDIVVEGVAEPVTDRAALGELAKAWEEKYGSEWHFDVTEGDVEPGFASREGVARVFRIAPVTAFGFGKGPFSQTRWRF